MLQSGCFRRRGIGRFRSILLAAALAAGSTVCVGAMLPPEVMQDLARPWPPSGWAEILDLPSGQTEPHRSQAMVRHGYFGQTLYRHIAGTREYWTANVLIQDRGDSSAAWRAVSAVRCKSRIFRGYRARECTRGGGGVLTKTLHYEIGRFYVTIQVSGPGETEYPEFDIGSAPLRPPF